MLVQNNNDSDTGSIHILEVLGNAIVGGMENYVRNLIYHLASDRFRVTCLCPYESAYTALLRQMGCNVFVACMEDDPPWRSIQTTVEIIRHQRVNLIHAHLPKAHVLAGLAGSLTHTPVVATIHGMSITSHELGINRTTGTHLVVVCQEAYMQALAMGVPPQQVTLIPNGVDLERFASAPSGEQFRATLGVPPNAPLVGFVGRLAWEKGPDHFVRAAKQVHNERPDTHFVMVGEGPMEEELITMIQDMGLAECLRLAGLWQNMAEVYPALDILVQTSRIEGMPLSLLEAMACSRPAVAMGVGGVRELVEVGATGMLVGNGDWEGAGKTVAALLSQPERLKQMGRAGRKRVEELFDLRLSVRQLSELFYRLAKPKSRHHANELARWPAVNGVR